MAKKTKAPKRATRATKAPSSKNQNDASTYSQSARDANGMLQLVEGSPVFVRWQAGMFKLALLAGYTRDGKPKAQICAVDPKGRYLPRFGTEVRTFECDEVSRVYMEADWLALGTNPSRPGAVGENASDRDARLKRGPSHDELQRPMNDNGASPGVITMSVHDDISAEKVSEAILAGRDVSRSTMHELSRWVMHMHEVAETWKNRVDDLETRDEQRAEDATRTMPKRGDIIDVRDVANPRLRYPVRVCSVMGADIDFVDHTDSGGSRSLIHGPDSAHPMWWPSETTVAAFNAMGAKWQQEQAAKSAPTRDVAPSSPPLAQTFTSDTKPGSRRKDLPKSGDHIDVDSVGLCVVESCARGYIVFHAANGGAKGRRRTSDTGWKVVTVAAPKENPLIVEADRQRRSLDEKNVPANGTKIAVRSGGAWEVVTVVSYDGPSRLVSFAADDGVGGTLRMSDFDRTWRALSSAELARTRTVTQTKSPSELAQIVEAECNEIEKAGNKAARKAAGTKQTPVERAVSDAAKMVVTSERMGPAIEQSFVEEHPPIVQPMSLHKRNLAAVKRLGLSLDEVIRRREAGTLALGPEDREAEAESKRASDRASAGLAGDGSVQSVATGRSGDFVSLPRVGEMVYVMSVSGWFPTTVTSIRHGGFVVQGGLVLGPGDHGRAWLSEREHALHQPDAEELAVASDRELRELGKKRIADGTIEQLDSNDHIAEVNEDATFPPPVDADFAYDAGGRMPWE